jgi:hypothetical protein
MIRHAIHQNTIVIEQNRSDHDLSSGFAVNGGEYGTAPDDSGLIFGLAFGEFD